ncbi:MAG: ABC transporter substrate-binding protein [Francisellaceae bacterium]
MKWFLSLLCGCVFFLPVFANKLSVVSLSPNTTEIIYDLLQDGAPENVELTGILYYPGQPSYYAKFEDIGGYQAINIAKIIKLKPDVVITWKDQTDPKTLVLLRRFGINVSVFSAQTITELKKAVMEIGRALALSDIARESVRSFDHELKRIHETYGAADKNRPTVFIQIADKPLYGIGGVGIINDVIDFCGGKNIFANIDKISFMVNPEAILLKNPDYIIMLDGASKSINRVDDSVWQRALGLAAVKKHHVYRVSSAKIAQYSLKIISGITQICDILHSH